jgi:DNA-binding NarL/FixJ family response regulator
VDDADLRADLLHAQDDPGEPGRSTPTARRLRPGVLEDLDLVSALTALVTDLSTRTGLAILHDFQPGPPALNEQTELIVRRVAQEVSCARSMSMAARNEQYFFQALRAGAAGYVLKSVADRDLLEACHAAIRGPSLTRER